MHQNRAHICRRSDTTRSNAAHTRYSARIRRHRPVRPGYNSRMERRLNSRPVVLVAWTIVAGLLLAGIGLAAYIAIPALTGSDSDRPLADASVVAPSATPPLTGRTIFSGTLERAEGAALVVRTGGTEPARVVVRQGAQVGRIVFASVTDIKPGDPVLLSMSRQQDGRQIATRVRVQPLEIPSPNAGAGFGDGRGNALPEIVGTVVTAEGGRLQIRTNRGEVPVELSAGARVSRFLPVAAADLRAGQRLVIDGERLVDGSLAALSVQAFDQN